MGKINTKGLGGIIRKAQEELPPVESAPKELPWKLSEGPQTLAAESKADAVFFGGSAGGGKCLNVDTPVLSGDGWKTMGEVIVGDRVFDDQGLPCNVVAVSEVMRDRECYEITFSGSSKIIADSQHGWAVSTESWILGILHTFSPPSIKTTKEIFETFMTAAGGCRYSILGKTPLATSTYGADIALKAGTSLRRWITSVVPVSSVPVCCIQVDSPSSLFLVGRSLIPTHNSALLLILAATKHRKSIIFRRVYPNLKGMIEKSKELLKGVGRYNSTDKMWRGLPDDRTLEFGSMEYEDDKEKYRGNDHDGKFFDELTEISQSQFEFVSGWCRTTTPGQQCKIVATFNPPSSRKGAWIIKKLAPWLDVKYSGTPAEPGELRWFIRDRENNEEVEVPDGDLITYKGEILQPRSRTFIPSSLDDNAFLRDSGYRAMLQSMPEPLRSQLLYGDFTLTDQDDAWQVIPTSWVRDAIARWTEKPVASYDAVGVDVSRGGADETVIAPRSGFWIDTLRVYPGLEVPDGDVLAGYVISHVTSKRTAINIDIIGVGYSPYDSLKRILAKGQKINGLNGGESSVTLDGDRKTDRTGLLGFVNRRAEWWWNLRELLDPRNGFEVALPDDEKMLADLTTPHWIPVAISDPESPIKSLVKLESKDEIKRRLKGGRSPDRGDAIVYAFAPVDESENPWEWMAGI